MSNKSFTVCLVMLLSCFCTVGVIFSRPVPIVVQTNLEMLPIVIAGYTAYEDSFPESVYRELNADKHVYRHYRSSNSGQIDLYIGYYGTAKGGRTGHNPYACLPGAGSAIIETKTVFLKKTSGEIVPVNFILSRNKDSLSTVMLHWYQISGDRVISTGLKQNIERFVGRILYNRNDGAFVRITAQAPEGQVNNTLIQVQNFAVELLKVLPEYWPLEK